MLVSPATKFALFFISWFIVSLSCSSSVDGAGCDAMHTLFGYVNRLPAIESNESGTTKSISNIVMIMKSDAYCTWTYNTSTVSVLELNSKSALVLQLFLLATGFCYWLQQYTGH
jgi:hypothetical protein